jgi:hypothetical protein
MGMAKIRQWSAATQPRRKGIRLTTALLPPHGSDQNFKTANRMKRAGPAALKRKYLQCFKVSTTNAATWQETVRSLLDQGVSRDDLVNWGVDAGYPRATVSSMLSRILCAIGLRERGKGAGRKFSQDALELLDYARSQHGERALKVLRSALRAGKAAAAGDLPDEPGAASVNTTNAATECRRLESNCDTAIRQDAPTAKFDRSTRPSVAAVSFKTAFNPTKD